MALHVVGVRHHSPACARLVRERIRALRPRHVLIEGPADFNARLDELRLPHELPIAIFTHYHHEERAHASWTPFCRHSPEWVALKVAQEVGAQARFIDLPAWHEAFVGVRNRYRDHRDRAAEYMAALCQRLRVDNVDALWDHLFEQPLAEAELAARLGAYFAAIRGEAPGDERDGPREAFMSRCIAWALGDAARAGGDVVVVCGGYHAPALERAAAPLAVAEPFPESTPPAEGARHGSYLVPYSWHRLDSFVGYESGLPSPAFYDAVWEHGASDAAERLLRRAVERLRARRQPVSPADLIACSTMAAGLQRLRGHVALGRSDLLDGIAGALLKDALEVPLPWSYRGQILPRTDPLLVEVMAAFSGERDGKLASATPRPPLLADVAQLLAAHDLETPPSGRFLKLDLGSDGDRQRSRVLHRLRVLGVPGYARTQGPKWATDPELVEAWKLSRDPDSEAALIEAAAWGPTLEQAATARLEEELLAAGGQLAALAQLLGEATFVGIGALALRVLAEVATRVHQEPSLSELGAAAARLLALWRHGELLGAQGAAQLGLVLAAIFDRGLWLYEGVQGPAAPADAGMIAAAVALRDLLRFGEQPLALAGARAAALMLRRAVDAQAPPALRGAAVGFLWSLRHFASASAAEAHVTAAVRGVALPATLGDFLAGLFALAREEVVESHGLLTVLDATLTQLAGEEFLVGLPSLRLAFTYFPPAERERIAERILELHGVAPARAATLLRLELSAEALARGVALDAAISDALKRYGL
jgi:hypothetical protein